MCIHVHMQASRSGDPQLYINAHVQALSGGFLQFLEFSVCLWTVGEQALWSCPQRGVCSSVSLQSGKGQAASPVWGVCWGARGLCRAREPPPTASGKEIQLVTGEKAIS